MMRDKNKVFYRIFKLKDNRAKIMAISSTFDSPEDAPIPVKLKKYPSIVINQNELEQAAKGKELRKLFFKKYCSKQDLRIDEEGKEFVMDLEDIKKECRARMSDELRNTCLEKQTKTTIMKINSLLVDTETSKNWSDIDWYKKAYEYIDGRRKPKIKKKLKEMIGE